MQKPLILVTGGAGFIGSHVNKLLHCSGFDTVVYDNLSKGSSAAVTNGRLIQGDLSDLHTLDSVFNNYRIDGVMHFAAVTDVGESVTNPSKYYQQNVSNTLSLLEIMQKHHVHRLLFSSSAAVYGMPQTEFIREDHPCAPINAYGQTKRIVELILEDYQKAYDLQWCALRYFNAAGGDPAGLIKSHSHNVNNLIPKVLRAIKNGSNKAIIYGDDYPTKDGTCIRDYIHVWDLAEAHCLALKHLIEGGKSDIYNLGNGNGFSVKEVLESIQEVTQVPLQIEIAARRQGDPPVLVAEATKAYQELGWKPNYPQLNTMVGHAWDALS